MHYLNPIGVSFNHSFNISPLTNSNGSCVMKNFEFKYTGSVIPGLTVSPSCATIPADCLPITVPNAIGIYTFTFNIIFFGPTPM